MKTFHIILNSLKPSLKISTLYGKPQKKGYSFRCEQNTFSGNLKQGPLRGGGGVEGCDINVLKIFFVDVEKLDICILLKTTYPKNIKKRKKIRFPLSLRGGGKGPNGTAIKKHLFLIAAFLRLIH